MPQCKHFQIKHQWEEYNQSCMSDQNESPLLKTIVIIQREYLISSKEIACLDVNWCLWDQPLMKGLCPSIGQTLERLNSTACSHSARVLIQSSQKMSTMMRRPCSRDHIKEINQSYPVLQCEMNLNTSEEQLYLKNHHRPKGVCPCVKYTIWNAPIMSHAPMWRKTTSDILRGMDMAQKSVIDWEEYASTSWSSDNKTLWDGYALV